MGAEIKNIEFVLPSIELKNKIFSESNSEYDFNKFEKIVGIKSRFVCSKNESTLTLAVEAVNKLIENNSIDKKEIDFVILCTQSPEYLLPTTACMIQEKCGLNTNLGALDINLGCSGYTYGLSLSKALITSKQAKNIILITSETYSKYLNKNDLVNRLIFGDAASATLISETNEDDGVGEFVFGTDGSGFDKLIVRNNYFNKEIKPQTKVYSKKNVYTDNDLYMDGSEVFNFTLERIPTLVKDIMLKNSILDEDIDQYIFHQANKFLIKSVATKSKINNKNLFFNMENYGNTVSSTIPIALKEYSEKINKTEKILIAGFGVGLSWSGTIINLNKPL